MDQAPTTGFGPQGPAATCVDVGGSGIQTVLLNDDGSYVVLAGAHAEPGRPLLVAAPGLHTDGRVVIASNLGWFDVDPADELGLAGPAHLLCNDAEAAALGESVLRPDRPELVFVGLGTGVGAATVDGDDVTPNLIAHGGGFGDRPCRCGETGCLETVAGGWALPTPLGSADLERVADALATAILGEPRCALPLVVVAGGLASAYPELIFRLARRLPDRTVEPSAAPPGVKSAAAWGLRHAYAIAAESV